MSIYQKSDGMATAFFLFLQKTTPTLWSVHQFSCDATLLGVETSNITAARHNAEPSPCN